MSQIILKLKLLKILPYLQLIFLDYIFPKITEGVEEVLREKGYNLLLFNSNNDIDKEISCLENIVDQDILGLIIEPAQSAINKLDKKYFKKLDAKI